MKEIMLKTKVIGFAEDKDIARDIRLHELEPALAGGDEAVLDFQGIDGATQSFIHALISETIRIHGVEVLDRLAFRNCNDTVKKIITIVIDYMQESQA